MENLPISMPPRSFRSRLQKIFYYMGSPGVTAAMGIYLSAFVFLGMFMARYIQQKMWYDGATKVANARIIGEEFNKDLKKSVYVVRYAATGAPEDIKTGYMVSTFVPQSMRDEPITILLGENNLVVWDNPSSFYRLGWAFVLFAIWIAVPSVALYYFIRPRREALQLLVMGLPAIAKLEKVDKSILSTAEKPKRLYNFQFEAFDEKIYDAKVSSRVGQWSEIKPNALVLYNIKNPNEQLIVDAMESPPKIDEEGLLLPTFSAEARTAIAVSLLLVGGLVILLWGILFAR